MMTRKHFEAIAQHLRSQRVQWLIQDHDDWTPEQINAAVRAVDDVARALAIEFQADNPRFDRERFLHAVGVKPLAAPRESHRDSLRAVSVTFDRHREDTMRITLGLLERHKVCESQRELFARTFPDGTDVTIETIETAREAGLRVWWLEGLIPASALGEYERATADPMAEYRRAVDAALAEYRRAADPAQAKYERAIEGLEAKYRRAVDAARAEYERAIDNAQAECLRAVTPTWAEYERAVDAALVAALA